MIKISIIVPVFNMEKYLSECLDSILNQSLKDIEVIAINDGSTDASLNILQEYASKDSRIIIINKDNEGVGAARNDGIRAAKGEFVAFMDSDDKYAGDDVLLHCYDVAKKENVLIAGGTLLYLCEDGTLENEENKETISFGATGLIDYKDYQYDYGYTKYIYQRKMLIDHSIFFPLYSRFQDPPFFVKAMYTAGKFYFMDEPVYVYRRLFGESKFTAKKTQDFLKAITDNLKFSREKDLVKLHYVSAQRLNKEGSFMIVKNMFGESRDELLFNLIKASSTVDAEWLRDNGYSEMYPFVPEAFKYAIDTAERYEKLRSNKLLKAINGITKRIRKKTHE